MQTKKKKNSAGITLMELIIVLAVIAIVGAIVAPNLFGIADRARLRSDVQSTIVLRNALDLYTLERGNPPTGTISQVLDYLYNQGYIASPVTPYGDLGPQTTGASWQLQGGTIVLTLPSGADTDSLTAQERTVLSNSP